MQFGKRIKFDADAFIRPKSSKPNHKSGGKTKKKNSTSLMVLPKKAGVNGDGNGTKRRSTLSTEEQKALRSSRIRRTTIRGLGDVFVSEQVRTLSSMPPGSPVTLEEVNQITSKLDVPPFLLKKFYPDAQTYYEATISQFIIINAITNMMGNQFEIPRVILDSISSPTSNFVTLRLLQDQIAVLLVTLQEANKISNQDRFFIAEQEILPSHQKYMPLSLQVFFYQNESYESLKDNFWKFKASGQLFDSASLSQPATTPEQMEEQRRIAIMIKVRNEYHKWLKNLYRNIERVRAQLSLFLVNPGSHLSPEADKSLMDSINSNDYPTIIYEDLILALLFDLWFQHRFLFITNPYVAEAELFYNGGGSNGVLRETLYNTIKNWNVM